MPGLGQLHLVAQRVLAQDYVALLQLAGQLQVVLGPTDGLLRCAPQGHRPQHLIVSGRHLMRNGLEGAFACSWATSTAISAWR